MENNNTCVVCATGNYPSFPFGKTMCEKHNVCIECGIKRADLDHAPWASSKGAFLCKPCETKLKAEGIKQRIADGFDHEDTDEVVCPHCGYEHSDSWEAGEGKGECPDCGGLFTMERDVSVSYSTEKLTNESKGGKS